jgi:uncharacterized membrane protein
MIEVVITHLLVLTILKDTTYAFISKSVSCLRVCRLRNLNAKWCESNVQLSIPADIERTYDLFSNLSEHPTWSPWLASVEKRKNSPVSVWTAKHLGFSISWRANNTIEQRPNTIQWESMDGMPNKGRVQFKEETAMNNTMVYLTISYNLPETFASALENMGGVKSYIEEMLLSDLKRFRARLLKDIRTERLIKLKDELKSNEN